MPPFWSEDPKVKTKINLTLWKRKQKDWSLLPTIAKSGFTLEVGPLPWGTAVGDLYLKTQLVMWQILDAIETRNKVIEEDKHKRHSLNDTDLEAISVSIPFFQAAECRPVDYPKSEIIVDGNRMSKIIAMTHPSFQGMDYLQKLTNETNIFIGLDGTTEYKFDEETMTLGEEEEIRSKKNFYPFFINETAYYEKGIAFCLAFKEIRQVAVAVRKTRHNSRLHL